MTDVWTTRGARYHSRNDCDGIIDGQAKAANEGKPNYPPRLVGLSTLQKDDDARQPCLRCWPRQPGWDGWLQVELETERHSGAKDGSEYELLFFHHVLMRLRPPLNPDWLIIQARVDREYGAPLRPDFVIAIPGRQPIALEADGKQKSAVSNPNEREDGLRRDAELERLGYRVQHFTNAQIANDASWCRERVTELMNAVESDWYARQRQASPPDAASRSVVAPAATTARKPFNWWKPVPWIVAAVAIAVIGRWTLFGDGGSGGGTGQPTSSGTCTDSAPIKGNISQDGEKIFHEPGWEFYTRTEAEDCFVTAEDAEDAGYRASERR